MTKHLALGFSFLALMGAVLFTSPAPASPPTDGSSPGKPLTCAGRCDRQLENCMKRSSSERDRADCPFEHSACNEKCPVPKAPKP
jgi:hypothetical protein